MIARRTYLAARLGHDTSGTASTRSPLFRASVKTTTKLQKVSFPSVPCRTLLSYHLMCLRVGRVFASA
eukprot:1022130-Amphidinium_carterae.1